MATPTANQREDRTPTKANPLSSLGVNPSAAKPTAPTQTINVYGSPATNARPVTKTQATPTPTKTITSPYNTTGPFNPMGGVGRGEYGPTGTSTSTSTATAGKTLVSRTPRTDAKGQIIGWDLVYSDGSTGFEPNAAYGQQQEETVGTTNVQVLKSLLLSKGLPSDLVEESVTFLQTLLKDGIDAESAISIYLNNKDFTTKTGTTVKSPFYTKYGFYNDALKDKYSAMELFNSVEGYKNVVTKYNISTKFASQDYIQGYLKNKRSVADLDELANVARLEAISADPAKVETLKQLNYINASTDLTDFYMDPNVGVEQMKQNVNTAAFAIEAVRRANKLTPFSAETAKQYGAQLTAQGLSQAQISALASQGYATIAESLAPATKLSGIYEGTAAQGATTIQSELEQEQFKGLESERRKRLTEQEIMAFKKQSGLTSQSLSTGSTSGLI